MHVHIVVPVPVEPTVRLYQLPEEILPFSRIRSGKMKSKKEALHAYGKGTRPALIANELFDLEGVFSVEFTQDSITLTISPYCCPTSKDLQVLMTLQKFVKDNITLGMIWNTAESAA